MADELCEPCIGSVLSQFFFGSLDMVSFIDIRNRAVSPLPHENIETHAFCISCYFEAHFSALRVRESYKVARCYNEYLTYISYCCMLYVAGVWWGSFVYLLRIPFFFLQPFRTLGNLLKIILAAGKSSNFMLFVA